MTLRALTLGLLLFAPLAAGAAPPSADRAYESARTAYRALKSDPARRKLRHHWLNVVGKFEAVAARYSKSPRAPDALYTSAELLAELSRVSAQPADLEGAMADYQKLLEGYPRHYLADDAALALARIAIDRKDDVAQARKLLERGMTQTPRGDRVREMKALLASLPAAAPKKPSERQPAVASARPGNDALAEAIARVATPDPGVHRTPAPKPAEAAPRTGALERVQERLRAFRVGEGDEKAAMAKLRQVARDEQGAKLGLAEQLGLKVRRVVIDAGHGGHDSGAIGAQGTREKDVTLAIATRLRTLLTRAGLEVVLTRDDDSFVRLEDRARQANEARGDLFISVHCNAAPSAKLRGVETYTLNTSSDRYSIRLAARENASSEKGISDLQFILADLATKANTEESSLLASKVQRGLVTALRAKHKEVRDLGNKEALFYVLLGAKMPAILVETAFLSNPEEEKLLASPAYQQELAVAIASGVQDFLGARQQRLAKID